MKIASMNNLILVLPTLFAMSAWGQDTAKNPPGNTGTRANVHNAVLYSKDRDLNLREYAELLRRDLKAQRVGLITQIMEFSPQDAAKFWPIFKEYDAELTKLGNGRIELIDDYIKNYAAITNEKADAIMSKAFDLEAQRAQLKKKYFGIMKVSLSAQTAARFFQVENQIQDLVDLQIAANLPTMK